MSREQLNLRLDSELKAKFQQICDRNRASITEALTEYITQCVEVDQLLTDSFLAASSSVKTDFNLEELLDRIDRLEKKSFPVNPNPSRLTPVITH